MIPVYCLRCIADQAEILAHGEHGVSGEGEIYVG